MASLDRQSSQLLQSLDIDIRRECLLKCLIMYLGEDASCLIKEYQVDQREEVEKEFEKTTMAFFVIRESDALSRPLVVQRITKLTSCSAAALVDDTRDVRATPNRGAAKLIRTNQNVASHPSTAHRTKQPIIRVKLHFPAPPNSQAYFTHPTPEA
ncbi:hypothetical protein QQF64_006689 [Cirrhinus molitorella]|uniref:Uncharacterized protein n=1 Tax=Cirrhinus molitorella TaxID=172907 RepID=A0ABR3M8L1_9TELE